jgi:hypothetical protein
MSSRYTRSRRRATASRSTRGGRGRGPRGERRAARRGGAASVDELMAAGPQMSEGLLPQPGGFEAWLRAPNLRFEVLLACVASDAVDEPARGYPDRQLGLSQSDELNRLAARELRPRLVAPNHDALDRGICKGLLEPRRRAVVRLAAPSKGKPRAPSEPPRRWERGRWLLPMAVGPHPPRWVHVLTCPQVVLREQRRPSVAGLRDERGCPRHLRGLRLRRDSDRRSGLRRSGLRRAVFVALTPGEEECENCGEDCHRDRHRDEPTRCPAVPAESVRPTRRLEFAAPPTFACAVSRGGRVRPA